MAVSFILRFAEAAVEILTQNEYLIDPDRTEGVEGGEIARQVLANKVWLQTSLCAAGLSEFIADNQSVDVTDDLTTTEYAGALINALSNTVGNKINIGVDNIANASVVQISSTEAPYNGYQIGDIIGFYKDSFAADKRNLGTMSMAILPFAFVPLKGNFINGVDDLPMGAVVGGNFYLAVYDGAQFILLNPSTNSTRLVARLIKELGSQTIQCDGVPVQISYDVNFPQVNMGGNDWADTTTSNLKPDFGNFTTSRTVYCIVKARQFFDSFSGGNGDDLRVELYIYKNDILIGGSSTGAIIDSIYTEKNMLDLEFTLSGEELFQTSTFTGGAPSGSHFSVYVKALSNNPANTIDAVGFGGFIGQAYNSFSIDYVRPELPQTI